MKYFFREWEDTIERYSLKENLFNIFLKLMDTSNPT